MVEKKDHRWWSLGVLAAGLSMIVLDGTIVGVALPTIISDLSLDLSDAQWVNALYAVVFAALLMSFGRLGDLIGRRTVFVAGIVIFVGGSILAAMATSGATLIAARAVQGVGGAMVLPSSLSTVNATFRGKDRAAAFGVWGAVMAGMAAIGPLLGGWLTTSFSWPWIFWVNVPIGVLVIAGALAVTPNTKGEADGETGFDWGGLVLSVLGFGAFVFAVIEGPSLGWWAPKADFDLLGITWPATRPISIVPIILAIGIGFIALFIAWQRLRLGAGKSVILNLSLFRISTFSWGNLTAMAVAVGEFALVFVLPLYLVGVLGLSTLGAGWVLAAMALGAFVSGAMARHLSARLGAPKVVILGLVLEVIGVALTALVMGRESSPVIIGAVLVIYGVGLGLASAQLTSTVLGDIPPERSGQGSATQSTVRQVGSAIGTAASGSALAAGLVYFLTKNLNAVGGLASEQVTKLVDATSASVGGNLSGMKDAAAAGQLGPNGQAIVDALLNGFASAASLAVWVAVGFLVLGLIGSVRVWFAHRDTHPANDAGDAVESPAA